MYDVENDACDVIVEMDNGIIYTAMFCTVPYLERQMDLSYEVSKTTPDTLPVRFAALETPHVLVANLERDTIEDTLDNLLALGTFASVFTQVTDDEDDELDYEFQPGKRATAEIAAVVLNEVLITQSDSTPTSTTTVA